MSTKLTTEQLQLQSFLLALLFNANLETVSWASLWNPNMSSNQGLNKHLFKLMTKERKDLLRFLMTESSVIFYENSIIFPEGFDENIPTIVSEFMRQIPVRLDESDAEEFPHDGCGGGAVSPISSHVCGADECDPAASDVSCRDDQSVVQHVPQICPYAGGSCRFHKTWGRCRKIHPEHDPQNGKLPPTRGRIIQVCINGLDCQFAENCSFPHPANMSCVIEHRTLQSGTRVNLVCVCPFFSKGKCTNKLCPYAHLSKEVVERAIERKNSAFKKRGGGKPVVSSSACSHDEVPRLAGNFTCLSMERECHQTYPSEPEDLFGILDGLFINDQPQAKSAPVAPSESQLILSSFGDWNEMIDPTTGLSYYKNKKTSEVTMANPRDLIRDACFAVSCQAFAEQNSASCVVACQASEQSNASYVVACQAFAEQNSASSVVACQAFAEQNSSSCVVSCQAFAEQNSASSVVACQAFAEQNSDS
jgi:hypothetical protein